MEIGHQRVDGPEAVARRDEDAGRAGPCGKPSVLRAALSSSRSDVVPTATTRLPRARAAFTRRGRRVGDLAGFGMHLVVGGVVGLDRQKGSRPDMQRHEMPLDALGVERREQLRREVQPGRRRRDGALVAGKDRLVVAAVALVVRALRGDIGRQRNMPDGMQRLVEERRRRGRSRAAPRRPRAFRSPSHRACRESRNCRHGRNGCGRRPRRAFPAARRPASGPARRACAASRRPAPSASPRRRMPLSCAGMTLVSLKTSTSPGSSSDGRSRDHPVLEIAAGRTTSSRAASRGFAGRSAIRSSGRSKSKRSTRIR